MPALGAVSSLATSGAVGVASDLAMAPDDRSRMLPVHPDIAGLLPKGGLRRGSTVAVRGGASLLFALLARATETGSWAAVVGMPDLGLRAAAELGVAVERLALVRHPGADLARVVAALLDGMDMVTVDPARLTDSQAHRLSARARHRGAVLLSTGLWPGADLELKRESATWVGLGDGHGHLAAQELHLRVRGRGAAARPTEAKLHLPMADGDATKDPFGTLPVPKGPSRPTLVTSSGALRLTVLHDPPATPATPATPAAPLPALPTGPALPTASAAASMAAPVVPAAASAAITPAAVEPAAALPSPSAPNAPFEKLGVLNASFGTLDALHEAFEALPTPRDGRRPLENDDPCVVDFALGPPASDASVFTGRSA